MRQPEDWHTRGRHKCGWEKEAPLDDVWFLAGKTCPGCGDYIAQGGWMGVGRDIESVVARWVPKERPGYVWYNPFTWPAIEYVLEYKK